ncbi:UDP-N-acetylmuramoyl-L-alanine--D-glutamate ligase [Anaerorhabdus sp.]|uniref:UDP-N-acetylmuramoyl-L-alanine--D-glutamate ligase n=1 Tax=Anaerorhabdus sp. TaxID=1872524 RepID=UPI002B21BEB4|nr:UDP-N-acetylmuramoyl-L-alanine--D-glutamate ligase [Anaerorhabdus sp.]MEA4874176.1 UDP-N-acetylmuramoyl-L-alanine--D-glutamate ligase [Anaerorhabdus sp.]
MRREELSKQFSNKKVLIWGFGLEGKSTLNFLKKHGDNTIIEIADDKELQVEGFKTMLTSNVDFNTYDIIMKSPGIVIEDESFPFNKLCSQSQLFLEKYRNQIIGITGTKGKSTTSSLLYHVLKENCNSVFLVGNIGVPCFDIIDEIQVDSKIVFEVSCHQLEYATVSPHIAVLLNLYEEHIDHYGTFEKYIAAKEKIFTNQCEGDVAIINLQCFDQVKKAPHCLTCSMDNRGDIYAEGNRLINPFSKIVVDENKVSLLGHHNFYNMAIVYIIAHHYFGVRDESFLEAIATFKTLPHRLQNIGIIDGVRYVDDSISTICQSTIQAIESLNDVDTVLVGGLDRGIDYNPLIDFLAISKVSNIIFMYASGKRIYDEWCKRVDKSAFVVENLEDAVKIAKNVTTKGKTCLLSPAAASYGYFKNFEERGDVFQELVKKNAI